MRNFKALTLCAALALAGFGGAVQAAEQQQGGNQNDSQNDSQGGYSGPDKLFITVTSDDTHTQGMSMILAMQAVKRGQQVRVLFCGDGTEMAVGRYRGASLEPVGANPQQIMKKLINEHDVQMEVCGVFLPNTRYGKENLIEGVGVAAPNEIGEYMADPKVRFFNH